MNNLTWLVIMLAAITLTVIAAGQLYEPVYVSPEDCNTWRRVEPEADCNEPVDYVESTELVVFLVAWEQAFPSVTYYVDLDPNKAIVEAGRRRVIYPLKGRIYIKRGDPNDTPMMRWLEFWKEYHAKNRNN